MSTEWIDMSEFDYDNHTPTFASKLTEEEDGIVIGGYARPIVHLYRNETHTFIIVPGVGDKEMSYQKVTLLNQDIVIVKDR